MFIILTSSPRMKTLSFCSSSSARASFRASRTVYSFPAACAYALLLGRVQGTALRKDDRRGDEAVGVRSRDVAGLNKRAAAMTANNQDEDEDEDRGREALYRQKKEVLLCRKRMGFSGVLIR